MSDENDYDHSLKIRRRGGCPADRELNWDDHLNLIYEALHEVDLEIAARLRGAHGATMLVVRIELWPLGDESRRKTIATGMIANTGTGTPTRGNYRVTLLNGNSRRWKSGTVENFPRKRLLGWDLLFRALRNLLADRNSDRNSENQPALKLPIRADNATQRSSSETHQ